MVSSQRSTWLISWTTFGNRQFGGAAGPVTEVTQRRLPLFPQLELGDSSAEGGVAVRERPLCVGRRDRVLLAPQQAETLSLKFQELAVSRGWTLLAAAIMRTHVQILLEAEARVTADSMIRDFKVSGSRMLNSRWPPPRRGSWWDDSGTMRKKHSAGAVASAVRYVANQNDSLVLWIAPGWRGIVRRK